MLLEGKALQVLAEMKDALKADNEQVLKLRLAKLDGLLSQYFTPKPQNWTLAA